jgi:hypothetical protein
MNLKASFRVATREDAHLPAYDNTKLQSINVCVTYGILRYQMHRAIEAKGRSMALECGSAMHEVFAWIRLVTLYNQLRDDTYRQVEMHHHHGNRIYGSERWRHIHSETANTDLTDMAKRGAIAVLDTSGYYDDPRDRRRTLSNMEECSLAYVDRWHWDRPVWIRDPTNIHSDCGIEIPFDLVVTIEGRSPFRFIGRIDGIHKHIDGLLYLHENKTASRLNDAWEMSFNISSQVTGYCVAASVFTQDVVDRAHVIGLAIPLPKQYDYGGFVQSGYERRDYHYTRWVKWLVHCIDLYEQYQNNPEEAPRYTHSCNRYYRPCQFIPYCDTDDEEERRMVEKDMIISEWSPLAKVAGDQQEEP